MKKKEDNTFSVGNLITTKNGFFLFIVINEKENTFDALLLGSVIKDEKRSVKKNLLKKNFKKFEGKMFTVDEENFLNFKKKIEKAKTLQKL